MSQINPPSFEFKFSSNTKDAPNKLKRRRLQPANNIAYRMRPANSRNIPVNSNGFILETKVNDNDNNNNNNGMPMFSWNDNVSNAFDFSFAPKPTDNSATQKRRIRMPEFDRAWQLETCLDALEINIKECESKLIELQRDRHDIQCEQRAIKSQIADWYKSWTLWNSDDFMYWIFNRIDNGYFEMKRKINSDKFDENEFKRKLNCIVNRFEPNTLFEGKHLKHIDILDVQQLFGFLTIDDCRKLYVEIEKLTKTEQHDTTIDGLCPICSTDKKEFALGCGHIFCSKCIDKINRCAFCNKSIDRTKIFKVFL